MEDIKDPVAPVAHEIANATYLEKAAKWAKFIAIVNFIGIGLGLIGMLFMLLGMIIAGASFSEISGIYGMAGIPGISTGIVIGYLVFLVVILAVAIFLALYLLRFATKTLAAIQEGNEVAMTEALANLARYFQLSGILIIISLAFAVMIVLFAVIFAASMAAGF